MPQGDFKKQLSRFWALCHGTWLLEDKPATDPNNFVPSSTSHTSFTICFASRNPKTQPCTSVNLSLLASPGTSKGGENWAWRLGNMRTEWGPGAQGSSSPGEIYWPWLLMSLLPGCLPVTWPSCLPTILPACLLRRLSVCRALDMDMAISLHPSVPGLDRMGVSSEPKIQQQSKSGKNKSQ